jgi:hypothetical protein
VSPEFGDVLKPGAVWVLSSGLTDTRPENSLAIACWVFELGGKFTVIVSPLLRAVTL